MFLSCKNKATPEMAYGGLVFIDLVFLCPRLFCRRETTFMWIMVAMKMNVSSRIMRKSWCSSYYAFGLMFFGKSCFNVPRIKAVAYINTGEIVCIGVKNGKT